MLFLGHFLIFSPLQAVLLLWILCDVPAPSYPPVMLQPEMFKESGLKVEISIYHYIGIFIVHCEEMSIRPKFCFPYHHLITSFLRILSSASRGAMTNSMGIESSSF